MANSRVLTDKVHESPDNDNTTRRRLHDPNPMLYFKYKQKDRTNEKESVIEMAHFVIWDLVNDTPAELDDEEYEENDFTMLGEAEAAVKDIIVGSIDVDSEFSDVMADLGVSEVADIAKEVGYLEIRKM